MVSYNISQVVPSIIKIRKIKDEFKKEYDYFISDYSEESFNEYSRYMKVIEWYPLNLFKIEFFDFVDAFYNKKQAWDFIRDIIIEFDYEDEIDCKDCLKKAMCYVNMDDDSRDDCDELYKIRDFKQGFLIFLFLKYFKTKKKSLIYD